MRFIYTSKGMSKKIWGARYTLGARYILKKYDISKSKSRHWPSGNIKIRNTFCENIFKFKMFCFLVNYLLFLL
jgi:hypothetical protein